MKILYFPQKQIKAVQELLQTKKIDAIEKKIVEIIETYCQAL